MARKTAGSLEAQRERIKRKYLRGPRTENTPVGEGALLQTERENKIEVCCHLKAAGFSYTYMAGALGVHEQTIKNWFGDEELDLAARVSVLHGDYTAAAVTLGATYLIEIMEGLIDIFRTTDDEKIAKEIGFEMLDRYGITKVNKSSSVVEQTKKTSLEVLDSTGMLARAKNAPPHVQAEMAEAVERLSALTSEYADIPESAEVAAHEAASNGE